MRAAGTIGLTRIPGWAGRAVSVGQFLNGAAPRHAVWSHALISVGDGFVVEARPSGAVRVEESAATGGGRAVWFTPAGVSGEQLAGAGDAAALLVGTPYSWVDYAAIAASRLGLRLLARGLDQYVADSQHMICSQLVAEAFRRAGVDLFPGRRTGDVTPADLARLREA